ncbi:unnamed protein product [Protopolystoma xenopodis]|uniref:Uncharacterized protein n=1 Tax=Protopolystoma xenopodis TaxID=117903 RepID=A0A3S5AUY2_9PLAT|nr:unnamed protein product [Protopolystoma xenopodis]
MSATSCGSAKPLSVVVPPFCSASTIQPVPREELVQSADGGPEQPQTGCLSRPVFAGAAGSIEQPADETEAQPAPLSNGQRASRPTQSVSQSEEEEAGSPAVGLPREDEHCWRPYLRVVTQATGVLVHLGQFAGFLGWPPSPAPETSAEIETKPETGTEIEPTGGQSACKALLLREVISFDSRRTQAHLMGQLTPAAVRMLVESSRHSQQARQRRSSGHCLVGLPGLGNPALGRPSQGDERSSITQLRREDKSE